MKAKTKLEELNELLAKDPGVMDSLPLLYREAVKKIRDMDGEG